MAYTRPHYPPYDDTDPNQPHLLGYPPDLPYQDEYHPSPFDTYNYQMNPYGDAPYPTDYPPKDGYEYSREYPRGPPLDYDEGSSNVPMGLTVDGGMSLDHRDGASERPRGSWSERERDTSPSFKRSPRRSSHLPPMLIRGHETYRSRKPSDRPAPGKNLDPYTLDHIVPFNYFCEWYKQTNARSLSKNTEISKDELQESFIKYRDDLLARTAKDFVNKRMGETWFKEKYDPTLAPATRAKLIEYRKWLYANFIKDLEAGKFDELTLDGAAARRHFAEKSGDTQSPPAKEDVEETSSTPSKVPADPMAERRTPCIKTISTTVSRTQLEDLLEDTNGFKYLSISDPNPNKKYARVGWIILNDPSNPDEVVNLLNDQRIHDDIYGDFIVHCVIHTAAKEQPRKALSDGHSTREFLMRDLRLAEHCATKRFEPELGEDFNGFQKIKEYVKTLVGDVEAHENEDEGVIHDDGIPDSLVEIKKLLDIAIEYFRRNDSVHELQRKCFAGHFRRPPPESTTDFKPTSVQKAWIDKINLLINPAQADVVKLGGVIVEDTLKKEIDLSITKEAEDRWRCGVRKCTKLFLEERFVRSHIQKRHKDWLDKITLEAQLLNCYVLDPCRVVSPAVEQPPAGFGVKYHPEKEYPGAPRFDPPPSVMPAFTGFPQFTMGQGMFDVPEWSMYSNGSIRGRRVGPGGPLRRPMYGARDHPYERRPGWNERRSSGEGIAVDRTKVRETRALRSYRDLDAPQEATPELNY